MKFLRAMLFYVLFYLCDLFMLRLRPCFRPHGCIDHGLLHDRASEAPRIWPCDPSALDQSLEYGPSLEEQVWRAVRRHRRVLP